MTQASTAADKLAGTRRRSRRSDDTKERIIDAAAKALAREGYESTSLEDVAAAAGLTKGTLYYHFDSKEAIYAAITVRYLDEALGALTAADTPGRPINEVIEAIIDEQLRDTMSSGARYMHYHEILRLSDGTQTLVRDKQRQYEQAFAAVLARGQRNGSVRMGDPTVLSMVAIGAIGRTARWYDPGGRVPPLEFASIVKQFVLNGLSQQTALQSDATDIDLEDLNSPV